MNKNNLAEACSHKSLIMKAKGTPRNIRLYTPGAAVRKLSIEVDFNY